MFRIQGLGCRVSWIKGLRSCCVVSLSLHRAVLRAGSRDFRMSLQCTAFGLLSAREIPAFRRVAECLCDLGRLVLIPKVPMVSLTVSYVPKRQAAVLVFISFLIPFLELLYYSLQLCSPLAGHQVHLSGTAQAIRNLAAKSNLIYMPARHCSGANPMLRCRGRQSETHGYFQDRHWQAIQ